MPGTSLVQSLQRGLEILQQVAQNPDGLRLADVTRLLGIKAPTAHNLIRTLVHHGFLAKRGHAYELGPAALDLALQNQRAARLQRAEAVCRELQRAFSEATVTYAEPHGTEVAVRVRMSPDRPGLVQRPLGSTFHLYANASGLALLAFAGAEEARAFRERFPFPEFGAHLWSSEPQLEAYLGTARRESVAILPFTAEDRLSLAVPILDAQGHLRGTLGLSLTLPVRDQGKLRKQVLAALREQAAALSDAQARRSAS